MATRVASQNTDTVDLVFLPLLIIIVVIFVLLVGSSRQRDATLKQTVSRQHHPARKEKTRQSKLTSRALTRLSHPKVPVEIVEHIIDYLQGNNRALATCKLVHRSWLPRARIHLHRTMIIEQGGPDPFKLKFFPQVARHVRKLVVSHVLLREVSSSVLAEIDRVECLQVISSSILRTPPLLSASDFPRFTQLNELRVDCHCFSSQSALLFSIAKSRHISSLSANLLHPQDDISAQDLASGRFQEALAQFAFLQLRTLRMRLRLTDTGALGPLPQILLNTAGNNLKNLTLINILPGSLETMFFTYSLMDFSKNTSLETLTVDFAWAPSLWYTGQTRHVNDARLAMSFLSQFCHTPLRVISLRIIISADRDTLLRQLRHLRFDWLGIFVKHTLDELVDTGEQEGVRVLVENLQNLNVELRFSCDLRPHEARRVRRHVDSQLDSFTADGFLDLVVV